MGFLFLKNGAFQQLLGVRGPPARLVPTGQALGREEEALVSQGMACWLGLLGLGLGPGVPQLVGRAPSRIMTLLCVFCRS